MGQQELEMALLWVPLALGLALLVELGWQALWGLVLERWGLGWLEPALVLVQLVEELEQGPELTGWLSVLEKNRSHFQHFRLL